MTVGCYSWSTTSAVALFLPNKLLFPIEILELPHAGGHWSVVFGTTVFPDFEQW